MKTTTDVYYDPYDFEIDTDPHPVWRRMRDEAPLYRNDKFEFWALSRFEDVASGLVDWKTYSSARGTVLELGRKYHVPLMFSLAQMSYWSAKHLGDTGLKAMQERGRMQVGMVADITIFDPLKAKTEATFKQGEQGRPTSGIPYVIGSTRAGWVFFQRKLLSRMATLRIGICN